MTHATSGIKIKLGKGQYIKDGKIVSRPVALSRPAQYAKRKKQTWRAAK